MFGIAHEMLLFNLKQQMRLLENLGLGFFVKKLIDSLTLSTKKKSFDKFLLTKFYCCRFDGDFSTKIPTLRKFKKRWHKNI